MNLFEPDSLCKKNIFFLRKKKIFFLRKKKIFFLRKKKIFFLHKLSGSKRFKEVFAGSSAGSKRFEPVLVANRFVPPGEVQKVCMPASRFVSTVRHESGDVGKF